VAQTGQLREAGGRTGDNHYGRALEHSDAELALAILMLVGHLGQNLHDALVAGADTELVGNAEVLVVCSLSMKESLRPSDVMALTGLSSGGVTKLIDRLEAGGLILRELGTDPNDRRVTRLVLTPQGERAARGFSNAVIAEVGVLRRQFTELLAATEPLVATKD